VRRLRAAGALVIGKTNLDQFATGLVGVRSPYGAPSSVFDDDYISGGSSSGSAVAVAGGIASFALGTDTAGSGRVPAAFNHLVGWKPTKGLLSTRGLVPACRSLDCITVFARDADDAALVDSVVAGFDEEDIYSRRLADRPLGQRLAVPLPSNLPWFGDVQAEYLYASTWFPSMSPRCWKPPSCSITAPGLLSAPQPWKRCWPRCPRPSIRR